MEELIGDYSKHPTTVCSMLFLWEKSLQSTFPGSCIEHQQLGLSHSTILRVCNPPPLDLSWIEYQQLVPSQSNSVLLLPSCLAYLAKSYSTLRPAISRSISATLLFTSLHRMQELLTNLSRNMSTPTPSSHLFANSCQLLHISDRWTS